MYFEILQQKIGNATKKAFTEMYEQHGAEDIYAFALYSDECAYTVCASTNTMKHFDSIEKENDTSAYYYKFKSAEWKYENEGADEELTEIYNMLEEERDKHPDDDEWLEGFAKQLFEACISVLEKLKQENFFSSITGKEVFLNFTVSDYDFSREELRSIVTRLNDNKYREEYFDWMKTWC